MPLFTLHRFDSDSGEGKLVRMMFDFGNASYLERLYSNNQWASAKHNEILFPYQKLPVLEVGNDVISGGFAIARYLARIFGMAGKDNLEMAIVDSIIYCFIDLLDRQKSIDRLPEGTRKNNEYDDFHGTQVPVALDNLEKILERNNNGENFFVGDTMTWADIVFVYAYEEMDDTTFEDSPLLTRLYQRVHAERRKKHHQFLPNGNFAK